MKRNFMLAILVWSMFRVFPVMAQEEITYRKITTLTITNKVGYTIGIRINHEFVDYVFPGEQFTYNFGVFPGEVFSVKVTASIGYDTSEMSRMIRYGMNPIPIVFTKKNFERSSWHENEVRNMVVTIANETTHPLEILFEGKRIKVCCPSDTVVIRVPQGMLLIRSIRTNESKFITREIMQSTTFIIKDSDFWFY